MCTSWKKGRLNATRRRRIYGHPAGVRRFRSLVKAVRHLPPTDRSHFRRLLVHHHRPRPRRSLTPTFLEHLERRRARVADETIALYANRSIRVGGRRERERSRPCPSRRPIRDVSFFCQPPVQRSIDHSTRSLNLGITPRPYTDFCGRICSVDDD